MTCCIGPLTTMGTRFQDPHRLDPTGRAHGRVGRYLREIDSKRSNSRQAQKFRRRA
jgi:hypothetical protein